MADQVAYEPTVFVKEIDGIPRERTAYNPSDEVACVFDGWQPKKAAKTAKTDK